MGGQGRSARLEVVGWKMENVHYRVFKSFLMKNLTPTGGDGGGGGGCAVESKRQFTIIIFSLCFFLKLIETLEFSFTIIIYKSNSGGGVETARKIRSKERKENRVYTRNVPAAVCTVGLIYFKCHRYDVGRPRRRGTTTATTTSSRGRETKETQAYGGRAPHAQADAMRVSRAAEGNAL